MAFTARLRNAEGVQTLQYKMALVPEYSRGYTWNKNVAQMFYTIFSVLFYCSLVLTCPPVP